MNYPGNTLETTPLHLQGDFDQQVDQLLERVCLSRSELEGLADIVQDIEDAMNKCWKGCKVYLFGSIVAGLGTKTSDMDFVVQIPKWPNHHAVYQVRDYLKSLPRLFGDVQAMPEAEVPMVKCYHIPRHRYCDVTFSGYAATRNSKLVYFLLHLDNRALPLAMIVKHWSKVHYLTGINLMSSYTLTVMVIFYLQQVSILPPVCELQKNVEEFVVENWNTAFQEDFQFESKNEESLYALLGGFFVFYKNFKFDKFIITPFLGKPVARSQFLETESLPEEYEEYKSLVRKNVCERIQVTTKICIQDPFLHARNSAAAVFDKLAEKVIHHVREAAGKFEVVTKEKFLDALLTKIPYQDLP